MALVCSISEAKNIRDEATGSAVELTCSPHQASAMPRLSASNTASRSSDKTSVRFRAGSCRGIVNMPSCMGDLLVRGVRNGQLTA